MKINRYKNNWCKREEKLQDELIGHRRRCSCGHTIIALPASKNHKEYVVCNWCHKKVYKDDEKQKEHDKKVERENFRMKMWGLL